MKMFFFIYASRSTVYNIVVLQNSVVFNLGLQATTISQELKGLGRNVHVFRNGHLKQKYLLYRCIANSSGFQFMITGHVNISRSEKCENEMQLFCGTVSRS